MSVSPDASDTSDTPVRVVRRSTVVAAPAAEIFDLLADPSRHVEIDGSGTVQGARGEGPERLGPGSRFGMKMKLGVPYRITNEVVEFDEPRLISWRHFGGHVWRYRLEPADGGTVVTEEFDYRSVRAPFLLEWTGAPRRNAAAIEATLDRLGEVFGRPEPDTVR